MKLSIGSSIIIKAEQKLEGEDLKVTRDNDTSKDSLEDLFQICMVSQRCDLFRPKNANWNNCKQIQASFEYISTAIAKLLAVLMKCNRILESMMSTASEVSEYLQCLYLDWNPRKLICMLQSNSC